MSRIDKRFADLKAQGRAGFVTFITAGDPDHDTCARLLAQLPAAGADVIELGMPFSDPMADGPSVEAAGLRALANGASMKTTLKPFSTARTPSATARCDFPTPGGPWIRSVLFSRIHWHVASVSIRLRSSDG